MSGILVIIQGISRNQFKYIYLKNQKIFLNILLHFDNLHKILNILNKMLSLIT